MLIEKIATAPSEAAALDHSGGGDGAVSMGAKGSRPADADAPAPTGGGHARRTSKEPPASDSLAEPSNPLRLDASAARRLADACTMEDALEDAFASEYLLRFSEGEYSSENVSFLLLLRQLFCQREAAAATALAQQLCLSHVERGAALEVDMPPQLRDRLLAWHKSAQRDDTVRARTNAARAPPIVGRAPVPLP